MSHCHQLFIMNSPSSPVRASTGRDCGPGAIVTAATVMWYEV